MKNDQSYFHVYSDGKKADIPFGADELKVFAVNSIAIVAFQVGAVVLCYDINETHLHVVIRASPKAAQKFRAKLTIRICCHYSKFGLKEHLGKGFFLACDPISDRDELLQKIIYTFRNCLDFYRKAPWNYKWGVGNLYFCERSDLPSGLRIGDLSRRSQMAMLHTYEVLPQDWEYNQDGMLLPKCFVDYEEVERLFITPRAFLAFLFVRKEDEKQMKMQFSSRYIQERNLEELRNRGNKLCNSYFGKYLKAACFEERIKVAAKMLKEGSGVKSESLAKALYLKKEDLFKLL